MIIKTPNDTAYIVKFRKLFKIFDETTVDNYGRIHRTVWKEPMITCTVKEFKRSLTDTFSQWTGTSWCRYTDNYDEKLGVESALNKALSVSGLSEEEKKSIFEATMAQKKIRNNVVKPYMNTIDKRAFLKELNQAKHVLCQEGVVCQ